MQDHTGEWWVPTGEGLYRYPKLPNPELLARAHPRAIYTARDGLPSNNIFRLFEDSKGNIWIASMNHGLARWSRSNGQITTFLGSDGFSTTTAPSAFAEDRAGNIWIGCYWHDLVRYRHGTFTTWTPAEGFPTGSVFSLVVDHAGRLWAATTRGGLVRIDDPVSEHPKFLVYTKSDGLASNDVLLVKEDPAGNIVAVTPRGIDRLNPDNSRVTHYDVLVNGNAALFDRSGTLWLSGLEGLIALRPEEEHPPTLPSIRFTGLRIRGIKYSISDLGETTLALGALQPNDDELQIDYAGFDFAVAHSLLYQYKLEGADEDWSAPSKIRTVNYVRLPPGSYRLEVRAINSEGAVSNNPALLSFHILAPIWRRWWFLTAIGAVFVSFISALYRFRVNRLLAVERVRTNIATDLHDDIGSSLSQIAILSEVARREVSGPESSISQRLLRIGELSRDRLRIGHKFQRQQLISERSISSITD